MLLMAVLRSSSCAESDGCLYHNLVSDGRACLRFMLNGDDISVS